MKQSPRNLFAYVRAATILISSVCVLLISIGLAQSDFAQTSLAPSPTPAASSSPPASAKAEVDPIENSDGKSSKLTFSLYFFNGSVVTDLNVRHQWGSVTAWVAGFYDRTGGNKLIRVGGQYDYRRGWLHLVPTAEVAPLKPSQLRWAQSSAKEPRPRCSLTRALTSRPFSICFGIRVIR